MKTPFRVAALSLLIATAGHAAPAFTITTFNLGGGFAYEASYVNGINSHGDVVGTGSSGDAYVPFVYSGGGITPLPSVGYFDSADAISDNGNIVGYSDNIPSRYNSVSNTWTPLTSDDSGYDVADVNDVGDAVGRTYDSATGKIQAARFNADGSTTTLDTLRSDGSGGFVAAINASGQMVGDSMVENLFVTHAVLWESDGTIHDLGSLAGPNGYSAASAINDLGQIAGSSDNADGALRGFIWTADLFEELGVLPGYDSSEAMAINNLGQVAGRLNGDNGTGLFFYDGDTMWNLASLLPGGLAGAGLDSFYDIVGLNDAGQIVGNAFDTDLNRVGFILNLTSIPEPSTYAIAIAALLALAMWRKARRTR